MATEQPVVRDPGLPPSGGSVVRPRPRLPHLVPGIRGAATLPRSKSTDLGRSQSQDSQEQENHDIQGAFDSLGKTDFVRKYSRKGRVKNLPSPTSGSPKGPLFPAATPAASRPISLRRSRSYRIYKESAPEGSDAYSAGPAHTGSQESIPTSPSPVGFFTQFSRRLGRDRRIHSDKDTPGSPTGRDTSPDDGYSCEQHERTSSAGGESTDTGSTPYDESSAEHASEDACLVCAYEKGTLPKDVLYYESFPTSWAAAIPADTSDMTDHPFVTTLSIPPPITLEPASVLKKESKTNEDDSTDTEEIQPQHVCSKHHGKGAKHFIGQLCIKDILRKFGGHGPKKTPGTGIHKGANGRFLTHPPLKGRMSLPVGGVMDSNGFGSLREEPEISPTQEEVHYKESASSLADSHLAVSDVSDTYPDALAYVTSAPANTEKLERRNGKLPKFKSRSDPSGEKQNEPVDLPAVISSQSSPDLSEKGSEPSQPTTPLRKEFSPDLVVRGVDSPRSIEVNVQRFFKQSSDESEAWKTPPVSQQSSFEETYHIPIMNTELFIEECVDSPEAPSSPIVLSPEVTFVETPTCFLTPSVTSLALPTPGHRAIGRSHSSASVLIHKADEARQRRHGNARHSLEDDDSPELAGSMSVPNIPRKKSPRKQTLLDSKASFSSSDDFLDKAQEDQDKRDLIVQELYTTERFYVESLQMLVEKFMIPMKTQGMFDSALVDDIFYKINEIYMHHATFLSFMGQTMRNWDSSKSIGAIIAKTFSKQSVIECYVSYIENFPRAEKVLDALSNKSSFHRFVEQCERESPSKLPLKAQIVKPAQRIPRYELLIKRLIHHTPHDHADYSLLQHASRAIHKLAMSINSVKESKHEEDLQETLKKLEMLLITDLTAPERVYIRHDMITVMGRKDQCCIWLFSDLAVFSSVKRKSGTVNRKTTLLLQSSSGHDFAENVKHKTWLRVALEDMEIVTGMSSMNSKSLPDRESLEADQQALQQISDMISGLQVVEHQALDECVNDMLGHVNRQLAEQQLKASPPEANRADLLISTPEGLNNITIVFNSAEKKTLWESSLSEAKQKLSSTTDRCPPEFQQALPITKTRAGMQFSCASPIDGMNAVQNREVWVCNSDGYVGHICLLSLQPDPIVTLNTPVPGCNSRILCICAVPTFQPFKRTGSGRKQSQTHLPREVPSIQVQGSSTSSHDDDDEDGYISDSSMSSSDEDVMPLKVPTDDPGRRSRSHSPTPSQSNMPEGPVQDPEKSTMWLGTEDGCIHLLHSTDNIKTTKNRIKIQHNAGVLCIIYLDQKVFVSLANGDLVIYYRTQEGTWDIDNPRKLSLGNATTPVNKMLSVMGKLWCACQNDILVLNPVSLTVEHSFNASQENKKSIACMATSGLGVWLAAQGSSKVLLFHAKTYECIMDVSIAQAVAQKLQSADDIIRQHKTACLRITSLLVCKDLLWVGTSAGVILTLPIPKLSTSSEKTNLSTSGVVGLLQGHTGHVRFLTAVDITSGSTPASGAVPKRRASVTAHSVSMATKMLVISGGDGFEDFRNGSNVETAGKDDSTNHLLLWQV